MTIYWIEEINISNTVSVDIAHMEASGLDSTELAENKSNSSTDIHICVI